MATLNHSLEITYVWIDSYYYKAYVGRACVLGKKDACSVPARHGEIFLLTIAASSCFPSSFCALSLPRIGALLTIPLRIRIDPYSSSIFVDKLTSVRCSDVEDREDLGTNVCRIMIQILEH